MQRLNYEKLGRTKCRMFRGENIPPAFSRYRSETIPGFIHEILNVETEEEFHGLSARIRRYFGFDYFSWLVFISDYSGVVHTYCMIDYENECTEFYEREKALASDLRIPYTLSQLTPTYWGNGPLCSEFNRVLLTKSNPKQRDTVLRAHDLGVNRLTSFPFHGYRGDCGIFRLVHEKGGHSIPTQADLHHSLASIQYIATHLYEALIRIILDKGLVKLDVPVLSRREVDVLSWVAEGKSNANIGDLLCISENTVAKHLKSIHKKLDVKTRQHAVAKAISNNLILV